MQDKVLSLISLSKKAGALACGYDAVCAAIDKSADILVIISNDLSDNTQKKVYNKCNDRDINILIIDRTKDEMGAATGQKALGVMAVTNEKLSQQIIKIST